MATIPIRRALLSVSDKSGLVEFAKGLSKHGVELLSTGGTYRTLKEAGLPVVEVSEYTGFPEMLDGRVKTLHPKVHGGILHRRDLPEHVQTIAEHGIQPIDMVVVNLYPFEQTVAREGVSLEEAIEQIDIGGPSMIRSAAKNHSHVAVVTVSCQYESVLQELDAHDGQLSQETLQRLAVAAFRRTAEYDAAIHAYLSSAASQDSGPDADAFPAVLNLQVQRKATLRYGENPHQQAAFYVNPSYRPAGVASAEQLHGKELSYNNLLDLDAALSMARDFDRPCAIVIKHNNPCGAAVADDLENAFLKAYAGDPLSAFGSVIGFNREVDEATATALTEPGRFVEAIIAPEFSAKAIEILTTRPSWKTNVRLLRTGDLDAFQDERRSTPVWRAIEGGVLLQQPDLGPDGFEDRQVVTQTAPNESQLRDLWFAWAMVKHVRSNAIVLVKDESLIGVGAGQMSRVDSVRISIEKAGERVRGSVMGSDAFFPFRDNIDLAAQAGVAAIIQPGGSKRDDESVQACNEHGIAMLFTGKRHFKH